MAGGEWFVLPHIAPGMAPGVVVVGTVDALIEVLERAESEPARGTYAWRLGEAVAGVTTCRPCEIIR